MEEYEPEEGEEEPKVAGKPADDEAQPPQPPLAPAPSDASSQGGLGGRSPTLVGFAHAASTPAAAPTCCMHPLQLRPHACMCATNFAFCSQGRGRPLRLLLRVTHPYFGRLWRIIKASGLPFACALQGASRARQQGL